MKILATILIIIPLLSGANEIIVESRNQDVFPIQKDEFEYLPNKTKMINSEKRDLFFEKNGILKKVKSYDELEKNLLYFRIKKISLDRLFKLYPTIPKESLKKAKLELKDFS